MVTKIFIFIGRLLNWSPIFHISSDSDFGSYDGTKNDIRFSLINISFGRYKYYFISIAKLKSSWHAVVFLKLDLLEIVDSGSRNSIDEKIVKYVEDVANFDDEKLTYHIDFLKEKNNQSQSRISSSYTKLTNYRALLLAMAAANTYLLAESIKTSDFSILTISSLIFSVLFVVYVFSALLQIAHALKVKTMVRATFKILKENTTKIALAKSFYIDFLSLNNEAIIATTITKNTEKYSNRSFFVLLTAWLFLFLEQQTLIPVKAFDNSAFNDEYVVINENKVLQPKQMADFFNRMNSLDGRLYIISNKSTDGVKEFTDFVNKYSFKNLEIEVVSLESGTLKENVVLLKLRSK